MKLALKIVVVCLVAMILVTVMSGYIIIQREYNEVRKKQLRYATTVGNVIRESVDLVYNSDGHQGIFRAIRTHAVEKGNIQYRWVWFDVSMSDPNHPAASMSLLDDIFNGKIDSVATHQNGIDRLHTYFPIDVNDRSAGKIRKGAIELSGSLEPAEREAWHTIKTGISAMVALTLFCIAVVTWIGIRMIGRPLTRLVEHTREIGNGVYDHPVYINTRDEFHELAIALNSMSDKISAQQRRIEDEANARESALEQLRHADRLKTVGRLAAGIAHEIGTPLNVVSGRASLIRGGRLNQEELNESAEAIQSETNRISGIVGQLMDFARHNPPNRHSTDLRIPTERTIKLLHALAKTNNVSIEYEFIGDGPFTAYVDESQIQQVLTNLIMNAIHAMPTGGKIEVRIENVDVDPAKQQAFDNSRLQPWAMIEIRDQGTGIHPTALDHVFEPFFTTKEIGKGTGLGLSIAYGIIAEHGGTIGVESELGVGTRFRVLLPKNRPDLDLEQELK